MSYLDSKFFVYLKDVLMSLNDYRLELGIFTGTSQRKVQAGLTNAELMFIHENGSPLRNIPSRPVIQMTMDYARKNFMDDTFDKCVQLTVDGRANEIELELNKLAMKVENYARKIIYSNDGRLAPNAQSTINRKGDNHPLFDTGQLARSITCRVVKVR